MNYSAKIYFLKEDMNGFVFPAFIDCCQQWVKPSNLNSLSYLCCSSSMLVVSSLLLVLPSVLS